MTKKPLLNDANNVVIFHVNLIEKYKFRIKI